MKPIRHHLLWLLLVVPLAAAEPADAADFYDDLPGYMMQIEVATKTSQLMSRVPNSTAILTRKDFERLGLTTLEDVEAASQPLFILIKATECRANCRSGFPAAFHTHKSDRMSRKL